MVINEVEEEGKGPLSLFLGGEGGKGRSSVVAQYQPSELLQQWHHYPLPGEEPFPFLTKGGERDGDGFLWLSTAQRGPVLPSRKKRFLTTFLIRPGRKEKKKRAPATFISQAKEGRPGESFRKKRGLEDSNPHRGKKGEGRPASSKKKHKAGLISGTKHLQKKTPYRSRWKRRVWCFL